MTPERLQQLLAGKFPLSRTFTYEGKNPFEYNIYGQPITWLSEDVKVTDDRGKMIFVQPGVKRPDFWSPLAIKVVASKYFWGDQAKGEREDSIEKIVGRVSRFIGRQAVKQGYFIQEYSDVLRDEIAAICLNQLAVFNSPVWFNVGIQEYNLQAGGVSAWKWDAATDMIVPVLKTDDRPQCSACFIQSIQDNMESIMNVQQAEAVLFKAGSGTGTNRSPLRSSKEKLTGGGRPSGPVSFMKGYDAYANIIKSGGKTRRAAKMEILNVEHPDIMEFIEAKQKEEKKAWALIEAGYSGGMNGDAYSSIYFQNCNMSVRASDEFLKAAREDKEWQTKSVTTGELIETLKAKEIMMKIAEGTWTCGDPGMQYDTTINTWHTCKNSGRINASNPCVTGDTKVLTQDGKWTRIDAFLDQKTTILTNTGIVQEAEIDGSFKTGKKPVYKLTTESGYELKLTADHKVYTVNRGFVEARELTRDDRILLPARPVAPLTEVADPTFHQMLGVCLGDGCGGKAAHQMIQFTMNKPTEAPIVEKFAEYVSTNYEQATHHNTPATVQIIPTSAKYVITNTTLLKKFSQYVDVAQLADQKRISDALFALPLSAQKYVLQGLFTADGTVANYGAKSQYVAFDSTSLQLVKDVQLMLLGFGIKSKLYMNRRAGKSVSLLPDGKGGMRECPVKEMHSLRISRSSRILFEKAIGFMPESPKQARLQQLNAQVTAYKDYPIDAVESLDYIGVEEVYDLTEPMTHTFVANGITTHNCSEYMFLDDSACNLASINLLKLRTDDGKFDVEKFKSVCRFFSIAMDLLVDGSSYPTAQIARNSRDFRPLGLGYANLGALLMSLGLPYDSDSGRAVAAAITAIMCGEAYKTSAELAALVGPFPGYNKNKDSMLQVMRMHRDSVKKIDVEAMPDSLRYLANEAWDCWTDAVELGEKFGYRNSQMTVLAPTGTIAFMMDCDTTGIEPDIALVKYKVLSGGGMLKIINRSVPLALRTLGYSDEQINKIVEYIDKNDTIEGAPEINVEHLPVFDCAFKPAKGQRAIHYQGHIKMMAVSQPFISGAISKTINMPEDSSIKDIADAYIHAWEQGLKAVAIYRENSKRSQPLNTQKTDGEMVKKKNQQQQVVIAVQRKRLPQTRKSITHKFELTGHEGYLTVGLYDDGKPGEIFLTMHKVGSTVNGLVDAWATSVSVNLQYGVPVDVLFRKFRHQRFEPSGFVKNDTPGTLDQNSMPIRTASSIVDYVSQFMLARFGQGAATVEVEVPQLAAPEVKKEPEEQTTIVDFGHEGLVCPQCGGPAKRLGNCAMVCTQCKQTTRSGCGE
ncbi:intein-containing adenosylcobalamin-dependent ribonucleoside-diphosphate reductase [Candidatus Pacearchaeota archaeon]|nr:intein-containing adenosylcobalamin-dependent ribonucleoside-diphosphate reductase [Candidatus Pacearchaeota archaeon]